MNCTTILSKSRGTIILIYDISDPSRPINVTSPSITLVPWQNLFNFHTSVPVTPIYWNQRADPGNSLLMWGSRFHRYKINIYIYGVTYTKFISVYSWTNINRKCNNAMLVEVNQITRKNPLTKCLQHWRYHLNTYTNVFQNCSRTIHSLVHVAIYMSCYKFQMHWVGVNTKFTSWQLHSVNDHSRYKCTCMYTCFVFLNEQK